MDGHFGGDFGGHHDSGHHGGGHHHQDSDPTWFAAASSGGGNPMAGRPGWIGVGVLLVLLIGLGLLAH